jgi:hypothetical protein
MTPKTDSARRTAIEALLLFAALSLVVAHTAYWHASGRLADLFEQKDFFAVLYNLGLVLVSGGLLALLMARLTKLFGYEVTQIEHFDGADTPAKEAIER